MLLSHFYSLWNAEAVNVNWSAALNTFAYREQRSEMIKALVQPLSDIRLHYTWVDMWSNHDVVNTVQWTVTTTSTLVCSCTCSCNQPFINLLTAGWYDFHARRNDLYLCGEQWLPISDCSNWSSNVYEEPSLMKSVFLLVNNNIKLQQWKVISAVIHDIKPNITHWLTHQISRKRQD